MKWLHNLLKGVSLTGALFVFQACYGIKQGPLYEDGVAPMNFRMVHVEIPYVRNEKGPFLTFEDPQGFFQPKDTTLADLRERDIIVKLENFQ